MKKNYLGEIIFAAQQKANQTQDEYGRVYGVSGPACFKFEKGYVNPSLALWLRMASDAGLSNRRAVLLWVKAKLPSEYQEYVELEQAYGTESKTKLAKRKDHSKYTDRAFLLQAILNDSSIPAGLSELVRDDEMWALYRPTGPVINHLRDWKQKPVLGRFSGSVRVLHDVFGWTAP